MSSDNIFIRHINITSGLSVKNMRNPALNTVSSLRQTSTLGTDTTSALENGISNKHPKTASCYWQKEVHQPTK